MKIDEMKNMLLAYEKSYYEDGAEIVSDAEYDALKEKYLLKTNQEEYDFVPGGNLFDKFKHKTLILSLDKVNIVEKEELRKKIIELMDNDSIVIEPKFDGLTIVRYEDGSCVTRGDGITGYDVTQNCISINSLQFKSDMPVRSEVMMKKSTFLSINKKREEEGLYQFKNPRNAAAGMLRNINEKKVEGLTSFAYDIIGYNGTQEEMIQEMKEMNPTPYWKFEDADEAIDFISNFVREELDYEIDGLVIKSNCKNSLEKFGITSHHPKNAIAVKFVADKKWTRITDIIWSTGRTGKVVPVAIFEPVELMGSSVSKATLHNKGYIQALGLDVNTFKKDVCVTKANDIIPAIIDSKMTNELCTSDVFILNIPKYCPDCKEELIQINDQLFCKNEMCKEKVIAQATHMVSKAALDINGMSEESIRKMYDLLKENVNDIDFTFPLLFNKEEMFENLEGFAQKSTQNFLKERQEKTSNVKMSNFLIASGIPLMGKTVSRLLAKNFKRVSEIRGDLFTNGAKKILSLDGIGAEIVSSMKDNFNKIDTLEHLVKVIQSEYEETVKKENQLTFVITGTLEKSRSYYEELITASGNKVSGSVSKKTNYLLAGKDAGSKLKKAQDLNVRIIESEEELIKLL